MAGSTNYGSTFTFNSLSVGDCIVIGFPELATDAVDLTTHASGGWAESAPNGLIRVGDFTLSVLCETGMYAALLALMTAHTIDDAAIGNGIDSIGGSAWVKSVKLEDADAQSPDANKITVVLGCTGDWA